MGLAQTKEYYTYADYLEFDETVRCELIDGNVYMMAPPLRVHQRIIVKLVFQLESFLQDKPCEVYPAPFGVRLFPKADLSDDTVVEPDISVICDADKLDQRGCNGAPDLIVEILSPSTAHHDLLVKSRKYMKAGVKEYWIVDPEEPCVVVYSLKDGTYVTRAYEKTDTINVSVLPGCVVDLEPVFAGI